MVEPIFIDKNTKSLNTKGEFREIKDVNFLKDGTVECNEIIEDVTDGECYIDKEGNMHFKEFIEN